MNALILKTDKRIPEFDDVLRAHERIGPHVHRTPVLTSTFMNALTGAELFFKCENFQKAGAFKTRGACNAVFGLDEDSARRGVITHSSGNHGQSLCYAAGRRGIPATVIMPRTAPAVKKAAVCAYGGHIVECESNISSREAVCAGVAAKSGASFVHPYNDARVIAGQATCTRELIEDVAGLDAVIAPVGGGGLISGACLTLASTAPHIDIYAGEPRNVDDAYRSLKAGRLMAGDDMETIADGLKVPLRDLTWHFVRRYVEDIVPVCERDIADAMVLIWQRMKIVVEPSSAVPLAAILSAKTVFAGKRVGVIITGGNVDFDAVARGV